MPDLMEGPSRHRRCAESPTADPVRREVTVSAPSFPLDAYQAGPRSRAGPRIPPPMRPRPAPRDPRPSDVSSIELTGQRAYPPRLTRFQKKERSMRSIAAAMVLTSIFVLSFSAALAEDCVCRIEGYTVNVGNF